MTREASRAQKGVKAVSKVVIHQAPRDSRRRETDAGSPRFTTQLTMVQEARVVVLPILILLLATVTAALATGRQQGSLVPCFIGSAISAGSTATRSDPASAGSSRVHPASAQQQQQQHQQHQQQGNGTGNQTPPLARRMLLRRALAKPKLRTGGRTVTAVDTPARSAAPDVDNLFR